jgi:hypothetical protein
MAYVFNQDKTIQENRASFSDRRKSVVGYVKRWYKHPSEIKLSAKFPGMGILTRMVAITELNEEFNTNVNVPGCNSGESLSTLVGKVKHQMTPEWYRDYVKQAFLNSRRK